MNQWLIVIGLIGLIGVAKAATSAADDQVASFASKLNSRINMPMKGGMDTLKAYDHGTAFEKLKAAGAYDVWFGAPAPAAVNGKRCHISVIRGSSSTDIRYRAKHMGEAIEQGIKYGQEKSQKGDVFWLLFIGLGLPDQPVPRSAVQTLIPIARFGNYGLFAVPGTPADVVTALSMLAQNASSPELMEGVSLASLSAQAGGAGELASLVANQSAYTAGNESGSAAPAPVNTVGPQLKGYDPREANRPAPSNDPPPLKHIPIGAGSKPGLYICSLPSINPPEPPKPAPKPRLTMADYAKKAAQERAAFQVRKAKAAADSKAIFDWMVDGRKKREADIRGAWQKRREYVDSQANRPDAILYGKIFAEGGWVKIPIRNRTDVTMMVTIDFEGFDEKGERILASPHITMLIALTAHDVILFAEPPRWKVISSRVSWVAAPGEYQSKVPIPY